MGFIDPKTGKERIYSVEEIKKATPLMRGHMLTALCAAGSGHSGGSLSAFDLMAVLYLNKMKHNPSNLKWGDRDRFFLSKAHVVPALYACLSWTGYFPFEEVMSLRKLGSGFQGHCCRLSCRGIEMSGGSLGQGLGIAVGDAISAKLDGKNYRVYCMMGDGEQQEGSIWESVESASHHKLDNLTAIVDKNRLQIDGWVKDIMNIDPLTERYGSFGWHVIEIDGHNHQEILGAFNEAETVKGKPTVIIAHTVKGKGVSFMEDEAGWHGKAPNREELASALKELGVEGKVPVEELFKYAKEFQEKVDEKVKKEFPEVKPSYWWNASDEMQAEMHPTRKGWGKALAEIGDDERIVTLHADISDSITITQFEKANPERKNRVFSVGIAEANMMLVAAGLAKEGKIPITGTYGVFASGRPWDMLRTTICYANLNVKIGGAHGGISVGADGATHQALEEIAIISILPNMHLFVPCDVIETNKLTKKSTLEVNGPCYVRFAREATPIVTNESTPCEVGKANVIRFRGKKKNFAEAFQIRLAKDHKNENENLTIIACGPMVAEAMRAAWILKEEKGIEARVLNIHTVKPIDREAILKAVSETKKIITAEEHQVGGFGNIVAGVIAEGKKQDEGFEMRMVGVQDRFGESGQPWELMKAFGLTAEHIVKKAEELL